MKIRNKKTGEIIELLAKPSFVKRNESYLDSEINTFDSLAELNEEWEDYEESYCITTFGEIVKIDKDYDCPSVLQQLKEIGNYFETKEEAEKAVEKLKAWKRLKDKGIRFKKWESYEETSGLSFPDRHIVNSYTAIFDFNKPCRKYEIENEAKADLNLLFGGEE